MDFMNKIKGRVLFEFGIWNLRGAGLFICISIISMLIFYFYV